MKYSRDLWFNAYLISKGYKIVSVDVNSNKKVSCHFDIPESEWKELKIEFQRSEIRKFRDYLDQIKDLGY